jgi:hypothetical protein
MAPCPSDQGKQATLCSCCASPSQVWVKILYQWMNMMMNWAVVLIIQLFWGKTVPKFDPLADGVTVLSFPIFFPTLSQIRKFPAVYDL